MLIILAILNFIRHFICLNVRLQLDVRRTASQQNKITKTSMQNKNKAFHNYRTFFWFCKFFQLKIQYQLSWTVAPAGVRSINWFITLNSIHKNHNNPQNKGIHSLKIKRQMLIKTSNEIVTWECVETFLLQHHNDHVWTQSKGINTLSVSVNASVVACIGIHSDTWERVWNQFSSVTIYQHWLLTLTLGVFTA